MSYKGPEVKITTTKKPNAGFGCKRCGCRPALVGCNSLCGVCYDLTTKPKQPEPFETEVVPGGVKG